MTKKLESQVICGLACAAGAGCLGEHLFGLWPGAVCAILGFLLGFRSQK